MASAIIIIIDESSYTPEEAAEYLRDLLAEGAEVDLDATDYGGDPSDIATAEYEDITLIKPLTERGVGLVTEVEQALTAG